jgi:hypothetical protein
MNWLLSRLKSKFKDNIKMKHRESVKLWTGLFWYRVEALEIWQEPLQ